MKTSLLRPILLGLFAITLILAACGGGAGTTGIPGPPPPEELDAQGFVLPELPRITCEQLKQMMDNGEPLVLVDTRIELFFNTEHLPQSINIPFQPEDEQTASFLALPKNSPIIFYCD
jgi:hypothetical protein